MNILFTGGGTLGSVTPLLAVYEELSRDGVKAHWIGTRMGPERTLVERAGIPFFAMTTGKVRRYIHWRNLVDPFLLVIGFVQAFIFLFRVRPDMIVNAGSFVGVPVVIAGWLIGIPSVIIQLDVEPVRSNLLTAPIASAICVAVVETAHHFPKEKTTVTGIPVRKLMSRPKPTSDRLTLLVTGGGIGAQKINELVLSSLDRLTSVADVIHYTGAFKDEEGLKAAQRNARYHPIAFGMKMTDLVRADVVVTRAGMGTLAELAMLGKPAVVIPLPDSPQEVNARYFENRHAAIVRSQKELTPERFADEVIELLDNEAIRQSLSRAIVKVFPHDASKRVAEIIQKRI
ncbi:MAG: UDP-N-acetylglucosamine--N-acetylmuramyl-(pentapeptide) pyrophosphoryl-undecaprenol N-acetylglucosamine transferase [Patescibacteria group bacterium]